MHVLLSHPFFWPYVSRGAEREVHGVGTGLAARRHRVDLVTGTPKGLTRSADVDGIHVRYLRTPRPHRGLSSESAFGPLAAGRALLSRADVVLSFHYADAYGVSRADRARRRRRPRVLKLTGALPRWYHEANGGRVDQALLRRALQVCDELWVNSPYVAEAMADWQVPLHVLPAGVDLDTFRPRAERSAEPTVLCTAAPDDPRKRLSDLLDGWPELLDVHPEARLLLAQDAGPATRQALLERLPASARSSVTFLGRVSADDLVLASSSAWAVVAPAVHEALGLATLEALACGTPVAGARSGATPWLLETPGTGALFSPSDPADLARAVLETMDLAARPETRELCRGATERFAWPGIIDQVERRLLDLTARS